MKNDNLNRTQALLQAFSGTQADLKAFIDSIPNDEEYKAYKAACPEPDTKWQGMTREQKTEYLVDLIMQLAEREAERQQQEQHKQLRKRLGYSTVICDLAFFELMNYIKEERAAKHDELLLLIDAFGYGVIHGIRKERARRAKREEPSSILYP